MTIVEICVGDLPSSLIAEQAGADRIELCADLCQGGTTPSLGTVAMALRLLKRIAVRVMVRPRGGDFRVSPEEEQVMLADIEAIAALSNPHGLSLGIVVGPLTTDNTLDLPVLRRIIAVADTIPVTVHKAFDEIADQHTALDQLLELGVQAVLTSGGAPTALEGAKRLAALREQAGDRLQIVAGGGVRVHNVRDIIAQSDVPAVHLRAPIPFQGREFTDSEQVQRVVAEVKGLVTDR